MDSEWNTAWAAAQDRLQQLSGLILQFPVAAERIHRMSQIDAELLDQELLSLVKQPLKAAFAVWDVRFHEAIQSLMT
jgi:peroxin-2